MQSSASDLSLLFVELGVVIGGLGMLARLASGRVPSGALDFVLNFVPGVVAARIFGWTWLPAFVLGGVTWVSSSGIIAKVLSETNRQNNPETSAILTVLVVEDLAMAVYLPVMTALLSDGSAAQMTISVGGALAIVAVALLLAFRYGRKLSGWLAHESDEVLLLTVLAVVLLIAGVAQRFQVSAAVAAFLGGVALSRPVARKSHELLSPLRDLFAATFFLFFGLEILPASLPPVALQAIGLGAAIIATKIATGYFSTRCAGLDARARWRAGLSLTARGEFSIIIASFGVIAQPQLGPLAAAYVLLMAIVGPVLARLV